MSHTGKSTDLSRRRFLGGAVAAGVGTLAVSNAVPAVAKGAMPIELPKLPYPDNALAPHISSQTLGFHYGKHHKAYVDNTNNMIKGTELEGASLEAIIKAAAGKPESKKLFNNAAQVWNHSFYWKSMSPKGGGTPSGRLKEQIDADLGGFDKAKEALAAAAVGQFGSGWAWLVLEGGKLKVAQTANAEMPVGAGGVPLLTIDVWEHAYYLDYQNRRPDYVTAFIDKLVNWEFAAENFANAKA
jgi:Fe-Mn family superoxide dismutase